jgi:hypothetical protein
VNRPDMNNPLPLWIALLVVPILMSALYLRFTGAPVPNQDEHIDNHLTGGDRSVTSRLTDINTTAVVDSPIMTVTQAPDETSVPNVGSVVGLDPAAARAAVQQVENSVYQRATAIFEREPVDVAWASAYEQSLRDMFAQHQGLQRVSINSISCHTSMCRIEVFTPRDADADFFTAMFYDGLAAFRAGELKAEAAITRRMELGMTSVYVARKDHTLGFY